MPRRKIQFYSGGLYHVLNRGAFKHRVFEKDKYCREFLRLLKTYSERFQISIVAYCIMPNHFHLVVRQEGPHSVSIFMRCVSHRFAMYYNLMQKKTGVVFEDRFKCISVSDDSYMYTLISYVHLNPVKARLCKHPKDWLYSNFNAFVGKKADTITNSIAVHDLFGDLESYKSVMTDNLRKLKF
ncbi:MAG: transposase [Ignavibacteria bacterium]|nr:transposase [Ignavibacteria bacterium]